MSRCGHTWLQRARKLFQTCQDVDEVVVAADVDVVEEEEEEGSEVGCLEVIEGVRTMKTYLWEIQV